MLIQARAAELPNVVTHPLQSAKSGFVENGGLFQLLCECNTWIQHLRAQNLG